MIIDTAVVPLFAGLKPKEVSRIEGICTSMLLPSGQTVTSENAFGHELVIVVSGAVAVERDGEPVAEVGPGGVIGEIAMLDGPYARRTATVRTMTECEVLAFSTGEFRRLLEEHPVVAARLDRTAASRRV
jgi:CRP-like cAMP-binding protein